MVVVVVMIVQEPLTPACMRACGGVGIKQLGRLVGWLVGWVGVSAGRAHCAPWGMIHLFTGSRWHWQASSRMHTPKPVLILTRVSVTLRPFSAFPLFEHKEQKPF